MLSGKIYIMTRYLHEPIKEDLAKKMVFIAGPRQVGKTTLIFLKKGSGFFRRENFCRACCEQAPFITKATSLNICHARLV